MTHTEKVHVLFGMLAAISGGLALWGVYRPASLARLIWPVIAFLIGFFLFIPVEAQTRTYQEVSWWTVLGSAIPQNPGTWIRDWFHYVGQWHVVQHKIGSFLMMVVGVVEFQRGRGRLAGQGWGFVLPGLLLGIGVAFGLHGGTAVHLTHRTEVIHHQVFGVAFAIAAVSLALVRTGRLRHPAWRGLWAALILAVGIDIGFFYRLTPEERVPAVHHHDAGGN